MPDNTVPTPANGKICYVEIPSTDIEGSVEFYTSCFGWKARQRRDGAWAFDDTTGQVSGAWVAGREPSTVAGVLVYIMVENINATIEAITAGGGRIVQEVGIDAPEITARFSDPDGNIFGLYQEPD